ncbi:hypothetical protein LMA00_18325 [Burkholderia ambifaria]|uniref:hypothetical protein n=1 Tax=Burkholderia ambifaria TaxID=152480 RepID=UPI001E53297C|nr:hypothetical protein [Burkholderia ambifaria]UEP51416.1 hypothetical protein LMA00_18325 [Burkholderia ambifaria]
MFDLQCQIEIASTFEPARDHGNHRRQISIDALEAALRGLAMRDNFHFILSGGEDLHLVEL